MKNIDKSILFFLYCKTKSNNDYFFIMHIILCCLSKIGRGPFYNHTNTIWDSICSFSYISINNII